MFYGRSHGLIRSSKYVSGDNFFYGRSHGLIHSSKYFSGDKCSMADLIDSFIQVSIPVVVNMLNEEKKYEDMMCINFHWQIYITPLFKLVSYSLIYSGQLLTSTSCGPL